MQLRPYQEEAIIAIRSAYKSGKKAPLLVLPTGAGKTVTFCHMAKAASERGKRVWILVHRIELLKQTLAALIHAGVDCAVVHPDYPQNAMRLVQVASVQTISRRLNRFERPDFIIIDEAHHATASTWQTIIGYAPSALLLGVTATPVRADGAGLGKIFDELIEGVSVSQLIELGYLVPPIIYAPERRIDLSEVKQVRGDYDQDSLIQLFDKPSITGDAVAAYTKHCAHAPAVAFCINVAHAEHVAESFRASGFRAEAVDGSMDAARREAILNGLADGSVEVVTSCNIISEGTDIPAITCAILLRATKSESLYIQQVGRALRPAPRKTKAIILDHVGNFWQHGSIEMEREWSLETKKKKKKQSAEQELKIMQCPQCFAAFMPAPKCPECGHELQIKKPKPTIEVRDGELVEVSKEDLAFMAKARRLEVSRARTMEELLQIEQARGYKNGWAAHIFRARGGKIS